MLFFNTILSVICLQSFPAASILSFSGKEENSGINDAIAEQNQGGHWSGKSQGCLIFLKGQGKVTEFCKLVGNFKYQERQGKVMEFHNLG